MHKRALIIGLDRDYCYVLREFLSLRDLYVTVVLDYKEGLDRLFYEKPDLTIIESSGTEPLRACVEAIEESNEFEIVDFDHGQALKAGAKSVLLFDDKSRINSLFDYLKTSYTRPHPERPPDTVDEGSLESTFYPSLLIDIHMNKRSGVLSINSSTNLIIYFINGNPVFAEGGDIETAIGRILLNSGKIDKETYEKTVDVASRSKQKFGQILFEMGITSPHELNSFLEFQMQEKILKGFYYIKGKYVFRAGEEFADRIVLYQVDISKVIYEGVKRYIDASTLGESNPIITIDPTLRSVINDLGLKPKELRFVQLLKDKTTVREVLEGSRLDKPEALKLLYFLSLFRLIKLSGISPDDMGRASIEKTIRENETVSGIGGAPEFHTDIEGVFTELKEREAETSMEPGHTDRQSDPVEDVVYQVEDELATEPEPEFETPSADTGASGPGFGQSEEDREPETTGEVNTGYGHENRLFSAHEEESKEQGFYVLENDERREPLTGDLPTGTTDTDSEPGFDPAAEASEDEPMAEDEYSITSQLQKSGQFQFGEESPGNEPGSEEHSPGQEYETGITGLFQPYKDFEEDSTVGEDAGSPSEGAGYILTGLPEDTDSSDAAESVEPGKDHLPGFSERVTEFHSTLEQKDHYEVLGVSRYSTLDEIRDSYYQLVKHYHPDVNPNADHETRAKAEDIFTRITTAYETLSQEDKRRQYDSHEELTVLKSQAKYIYEAEMNFKKGITLLIQRNYAEAEKYIGEAVRINPDEAAYLGAHGWTRFLAAENKASVLDEVRKSLERAIKMNDKIPENYYYLGCVCKHANDFRNAVKYFDKAIELDPDYIEAKREVRLINTRRTNVVKDKKIEKNFWSSLFKK